jgi:hypothetical protein
MKRSDYVQQIDVRSKTAWRAKHTTETSVRARTRDEAPVADEQQQELTEDATG